MGYLRGYGFPLGSVEQSSDVLILKLHGSMNWLVSVFGGATGGAFLVNPASSLGHHPVIYRVDLDYLGAMRCFQDTRMRAAAHFLASSSPVALNSLL